MTCPGAQTNALTIDFRSTYELGYAREWLLQIAHALDFCHERAISHRDGAFAGEVLASEV